MTTPKIITYDLRPPVQNYDTLISEIKKYSTCTGITESTWLIFSEDTCLTICNHLTQYIDTNDRIFVAELTGIAAWFNTICDSDYLKNLLQATS